MQRTAIVEGSISEDEATEVTVSSYDIVYFFFVTELVTVVLRFVYSAFTYQRGSYQASVYCRKERTTEYTSHT